MINSKIVGHTYIYISLVRFVNQISPTDLNVHLESHGLSVHRLLEASMVVSDNITDLKSFWKKLQRNVTDAARRNFIKVTVCFLCSDQHVEYSLRSLGVCVCDNIMAITQHPLPSSAIIVTSLYARDILQSSSLQIKGSYPLVLGQTTSCVFVARRSQQDS